MATVARIELDSQAVQDYARYLKQAPAIAREEMSRSVEEALNLLEREMKENTPTGAHGLLRESITHQLRGAALGDGAGVAGTVGSSLNYALPVELGTKPHFPPIEPLRDWVERKLGIGPEQSRSVAFLIARKISQRGTTGARMAGRAFDAAAAQVSAIIEAALPRIAARLMGGAS